MKFLIIGASGFIGSHLYSHIKDRGYDVIGTQTKARQNDLKVYNLLSTQPLELCIGKDFFEGEEQKVCVIMAAIRQIDKCAEDPKFSYLVNVTETFNLAKELRDKGVKVVFISTSFVFNGKSGFYNEENKKSPICEYARQKSLAEDLILRNVPGSLIFRFDKVLGTDPYEDHLFTEWLGLCKSGKPILCIKNNYFPGTLVDDIAKAILLGCVNNLEGVYHVANTQSIFRTELALRFVDKMGYDVSVVEKNTGYFKFKDNRSLRTDLDVRKFVDATDMKFTDFDKMIEMFKKNMRGGKK